MDIEWGGFHQRAGAGDRYAQPGYLRSDWRARFGHQFAAADWADWAAQAGCGDCCKWRRRARSTVFANPHSFFQRPLAESTLYLENEHIQYIHALCLARIGGEHDQVLTAAGKGKPTGVFYLPG